MEAGRSGIQGNPKLCSKFEATLSSMRPPQRKSISFPSWTLGIVATQSWQQLASSLIKTIPQAPFRFRHLGFIPRRIASSQGLRWVIHGSFLPHSAGIHGAALLSGPTQRFNTSSFSPSFLACMTYKATLVNGVQPWVLNAGFWSLPPHQLHPPPP